MSNKVIIALVVILVLVAGGLAYQNYRMSQQLNELKLEKDQGLVTGPAVNTGPQPGTEPGPFSDPNRDPLHGKSDGPPAITTVQFAKTVHDFGRINQGDVVTTTFKFKNTGNSLYLIEDAQGSCGCTVPQWPRDPIAAGQSGEITVTFDSKGKMGENEKTVTLTGNTNPGKIVLTVKSTVIPKEK